MLIAYNVNKQSVIGRNADKGEKYYCPECGAELVVKQGSCVVHHFAHKVKTDCEMQGETERHMAMKMLIYDTNPGGELEFKFHNRRADVCFPEDKLVVECQHSPISYRELCERNRDYKKLGYEVWWVWDTAYFLKGQNIETLKKDAGAGATTKGGWNEWRIPEAIRKVFTEITICDTKTVADVALCQPFYRDERDTSHGFFAGYYPKTLRRLAFI